MSQDVLPIPLPEPPAALTPTSRPGTRTLNYVVLERFVARDRTHRAYEVGDAFSSEDDALVADLRAAGLIKTRAELGRELREQDDSAPGKHHTLIEAFTVFGQAITIWEQQVATPPSAPLPLDEAAWWRQFHAIFAEAPTETALQSAALALAKAQLGPDYFPRIPKGFDSLDTIRR